MTQHPFRISQTTTVVTSDALNPVLKNAAMILQRDINRVASTQADDNTILLRLNRQSTLAGDDYQISQTDGTTVEVLARTPIGVMYGAIAISRSVLGIDDFWYWLDVPVSPKPVIEMTNFDLHLPNYRVPYRGWFVNDELLIMGWKDHDSKPYVWDRIFETAVRAGVNVIVPGTDVNSHTYRKPAQEFGLVIAQHHAEPLGAQMFARVYPNLEASYIKYPELFKKLWRDAILSQKGTATIYSLGFRGQGDKPFWLDDDSREWTDQAKADVINEIIQEQYDMVKKLDPGAKTAINIYGEVTAMYSKGLLKVPDDVIEIWADSGYGKMVSRRQHLDNPRSQVLDVPNPHNRARGIYYHVAFHDLQASNFLGLLSNRPSFVSSELMKVRQHNMDTLELINTGSIKPHILYLREVAKSWLANYKARSDQEILTDYVSTYYDKHQADIVWLYSRYWDAIVQYGVHKDETAGDEFAPYLIRRIIKAWITAAPKMSDTGWLTGSAKFDDELKKINTMIFPKFAEWDALLTDVKKMLLELKGHDRELLYNDYYLSVMNQAQGLKALNLLIETYAAFKEAKVQKDFLRPFLLADESYQTLKDVLAAQEGNPAGKWRDFYKNDGYNDVPLAVEQLKFLRHYIRTFGDGDDQDEWERNFIKAPSEARVMTLWTTAREFSDDQMAAKLQEYLVDRL
ncbi:hypothetical protein FEZ41_12725 [Lentilactobacillus parafarraginis]|uniref:Glycosyl hydrolase family 115 n=2 Tax=Lentilactobacillus parafarraginis TaxID=390842 RepID=A0A0R1YN43_9LACO|nr:glycosyl hydrolase 115 family protein [Lentilactobacillus parafarraginis]KRM43904.1 hypothetical protein FD47_GL001115 [Lentilactobacillus parafarraginis DSM 18390 = JCM 14109]TLQ16692.1 hypothetical protein FEZ41_12725 [Lentilactobacillus parafarraginis]